MASRSLADLRPDLAAKCAELDRRLASDGIDYLVYCTYRDEQEQARLYRQGRTRSQVEWKAADLRRRGFPKLAGTLISVGPQAGKVIVTKAGPGESYHQYKLAWDGAPVVDGKIMWDSRHPAWKQITKRMKELGGLEQLSFEQPHIQLAGVNIRDLMKQKWA